MNEFVKLQAQVQTQSKRDLLSAEDHDKDGKKTSTITNSEGKHGGGFFNYFAAACCSSSLISNNVVSPGNEVPSESVIIESNNKSTRSNASNRSNTSSNRQHRSLKKMLKGGGSSSRNKVKRRVFPGGLLVTRSFGDFYGKKEHLGGMKGGIIHDHGEVKTIDMRRDKVKYILLASDGIWDVLQVDQVIGIIENTRQAVNRANANNNNTGSSSSGAFLGIHSTTSSAGAAILSSTTNSMEDATKMNGKALSAVIPESIPSSPNSTRSGTSTG
jgi:hypothetical protein